MAGADNNQNPPGRLERLEQKLYERSAELPPVRRTRLSEAPAAPARDWQAVDAREDGSSRFSLPMLKKIFWLALIFFLVSGAIAGFIFWRGSNTVSVGNVEIELDGPVTVRAGEVASLQVAITNKNNISLEFVDLIAEYPEGSRVAGEAGAELTRVRQTLGTIKAGETVRRELAAVLFGEQNSQLSVKLNVEYRLADSNAIFDKQMIYEFTVAGSPLLLSLKAPAEANSNQEIALDLEALANSETPLVNTLVTVEYPPGFKFLRATPSPTNGNNVWRVATLKAGDKWPLRIFGTLEGQDDEEKTFRARAGMPSVANPNQVGALYGSDIQAVAIRRPYVSLSATLNNDPGVEYLATSRQAIRLEINWVNNLATEISDGEVLVEFSGVALEQSSVSPGHGFYQSGTNTIVWNKNSESDLALVAPGATGRVAATFNSVSLVAGSDNRLNSPMIDLKIKFRGRRTTETNASESIASEITRRVKFDSVPQLVAKALYYSGPFTNSGPLPPKVGEETTYTIVWTVVNSSNDLNEAKVTATLPPYMRWLGEMTPATETLVFNEDASGGGTIVWDLAEVKAGTGYTLASREVAFRVALNPSLNQVGSAPSLVSNSQLTAKDSFTGRVVSVNLRRNLDTNLNTDVQFKFGQDKVVQ